MLLPTEVWSCGKEAEGASRAMSTPAHLRWLTYLNGGFSPKEELEALRIVCEAAVVQGCAALACLFIQVPTARNTHGKREVMGWAQRRESN